MHTIFAQPGPDAHPGPDAAAQQRADRLARATAEQMEMALSFLSRIDPEAFEIALTAATPAADEIHEDEEAIPLCRRCGGLVGIFLSRGLQWQHFRGDGITSGAAASASRPVAMARLPLTDAIGPVYNPRSAANDWAPGRPTVARKPGGRCRFANLSVHVRCIDASRPRA